MKYNKLKTQSILDKLNKGQEKKVTPSTINKELKWCHNNFSFSTYSYCKKKKGKRLSSKEIVEKTHTGNCIGLSYGLQNILKKKYGIESYLIPATIPDSFKKPGYLEISHVALMIPGNKPWEFYVADPAFYFLKCLKIKPRSRGGKPEIGQMSNIYEKHVENVMTFEVHAKMTKNVFVFNEYQKISKLTPVVTCTEITQEIPGNLYGGFMNVKSEWSYFITEILNPDQAITSFFQEIWKDTPFITRTKIEKNTVLCPVSIHQRENNKITIKKYNIPYYDGLVRDLTPKEMNYWEKIFNMKSKLLKGTNWKKYLIKGEKCFF